MQKKLLIVANHARWYSWPEKIKELQKWFAPLGTLTVDITHTYYDDVPFVDYVGPDGSTGWLSVEENWYNLNVTTRAHGYDIVLLVLPVSQWKGQKARGWRTNNNPSGTWELQIGTDENEHQYRNGVDQGETFFIHGRHEILHALYAIANLPDNTHYWIDRNEPEQALIQLAPMLASNPIGLMQKSLDWARVQLTKMLEVLKSFKKIPMREQLYEAAVESLGKEMSPRDQAPDEFGCAESFCYVVRKVLPDFPVILSTKALLDHLNKDKRFKPTREPNRGNIIISATGTGNGSIPGHVGIHIGHGRIASNTSANGLWEDNFSVNAWVERYRNKGGMKIYYFEAV